MRPERRFYFALARELGMTVGALLGRITNRELSEWMAYFRLEEDEARQRDLIRRAEAGAVARARGPRVP